MLKQTPTRRVAALTLAAALGGAPAVAQTPTISPRAPAPTAEQEDADAEGSASAEPARDLFAEYQVAVTRHQRGDASGAVRAFKSIAVANPSWGDVFYNIGSISMELQNWHDCAFYFRRFLVLQPNDPQARTVARNIAHCETGIYNGGTLIVRAASPPAADIAINGVPYSDAGILGPVLLNRGEYTVTAEAFEHEPYEQVVTIHPGQTTEVEIRLTAIPQYGSAAFRVSQDGAEIFIDGASMGRTPLTEPIRLLVGTHQVEILREGYHPWRRNLDVLRDLDEVIDVRLISDAVDLNRIGR